MPGGVLVLQIMLKMAVVRELLIIIGRQVGGNQHGA
jgi:hypothetical protein